MQIKSANRITAISKPESADCVLDDDLKTALIKSNESSRDFSIYYRSVNMMTPHLVYAEHPDYEDEVAVSVSLVPTFEPTSPAEALLLDDEVPILTDLSQGKDFAFIFLIDRSASMNGVRMQTAKQALKLFLKSLPVGSKFAIISFGA